MAIRFKYEPEKAVEAILYVAANAGTNMYGTLKLLYAAEKLHLQRFGRPIYGDDMRANPKGATPDNAYDIMKYVAGKKPKYSGAVWAKDAFKIGDDFKIEPLRDPDVDHFSESDIEVLDELIARVAENPDEAHNELWNDAHDKAWTQVSEERPRKLINWEEIIATFPEEKELLEYLQAD